MSLNLSGEITAIATAVLGVFAIVTAAFAVLAFRKQSQEVRAIERQVKDQEKVTRQQAELLKVQFGQLEVQRQQFTDQREANARQADFFELQMDDLRDSIVKRAIEEERSRRAQASHVSVREDRHTGLKGGKERVLPHIVATVQNASDMPIYDAELAWQRSSARRDDRRLESLGTVMPGAEVSRSREFRSDTEMASNGAILTFRDAAGVTWVCRPDGTLKDRDREAEHRARAWLPRKAAGRFARDLQDIVVDYFAHEAATSAPLDTLSPDEPEPE